ncbi:hypothetical protein E3P99_00756 [Wallemia hederae]|uniref:N-lysine methyltransferase SETD6 n=1 Tax=Wallemia hederae TaxID=1540922 RepID=A0A4T0FUC0_9BASI|nr:hypothetical protein E3P99_00756 [Wallemia hederae]
MASSTQSFVDWFVNNGGEFSSELVKVVDDVEGMGRGLVAVKDIEPSDTLFTIPRSLILSTKTSAFKDKLGEQVYAQLHNGDIASWTPLIMAMCWEYNQGSASKWHPYFSVLPNDFSSLMFWPQQDLELLKGTTVVDRIGTQDIEAEFERVKGVIEKHQDVFGDSSKYTLDLFKRMGSLILSRSFTVVDWKPEEEEEEEASDDEDEEIDLRTSVDVVSMLPMADILNARSGSANAHTEYEEHKLRMIALKKIKAGEQVFNTYDDPPNSDLLRRYGHVDYVPLSEDGEYMGNQNDVAEIPADLILETALPDASEKVKERRVEFLLDECGEDVFELSHDDAVPELLKICVVLFTMPEADFKKHEKSRKVPKASAFSPENAELLSKVINERIAQYGSVLEDDISKLDQRDSLTRNHFNALVLTVGERRILKKALDQLQHTDHASKKQRVE